MKKNLPLIIGIALPILFILVISLVIFLPSMSIKPAHNFLYTNENPNNYGYDNRYKNTYEVDSVGHIGLISVPVRNNPYNEPIVYKGDTPPLYLYDVQADTTRQVSLDEANAMQYVRGPSSPDGYTVTYSRSNDGILEIFGSSRDEGYMITKGNGQKRLSGLQTTQYYYGDLNLVGWVK
jgi:hypothetical protein